MNTVDNTKLYKVTTCSNSFPSNEKYKMTFHWFVLGRTVAPVSYEDAIIDYDPAMEFGTFGERFIRELFTMPEAEALKAYLARWSGFFTEIHEVKLPISMMPYPPLPLSAIQLGKHQEFRKLFSENKYSLKFKVVGYCDTAPMVENNLNLAQVLF